MPDILSQELEKFKTSDLKEDSAAKEAGLQNGDIVTSIEDCVIPGGPANDAKKLMAHSLWHFRLVTSFNVVANCLKNIRTFDNVGPLLFSYFPALPD